MKIGVLSDTHGFFSPQLPGLFEAVDLIVHAGDIGNEDVITALEIIAPVKAVSGNVDTHPLSTRYPRVQLLLLNGIQCYVTHDFDESTLPPIFHLRDIRLVIYGHTHHSSWRQNNGIRMLNPGSAGRKGRGEPAMAALLTIRDNRRLQVTFHPLTP